MLKKMNIKNNIKYFLKDPEIKTYIYFIVCFLIWIPLRPSIVPDNVMILNPSYDFSAGEQLADFCEEHAIGGYPMAGTEENCWQEDLNPQYITDSQSGDQNSIVNAYVNVSYWSFIILFYYFNKRVKQDRRLSIYTLNLLHIANKLFRFSSEEKNLSDNQKQKLEESKTQYYDTLRHGEIDFPKYFVHDYKGSMYNYSGESKPWRWEYQKPWLSDWKDPRKD